MAWPERLWPTESGGKVFLPMRSFGVQANGVGRGSWLLDWPKGFSTEAARKLRECMSFSERFRLGVISSSGGKLSRSCSADEAILEFVSRRPLGARKKPRFACGVVVVFLHLRRRRWRIEAVARAHWFPEKASTKRAPFILQSGLPVVPQAALLRSSQIRADRKPWVEYFSEGQQSELRPPKLSSRGG